MVVEPLDIKSPISISFPLDRGEAAAITLACQLKSDVLLMDERRGREAARCLGLKVAGALGELLYAKRVGWIPCVRDEIHRLRHEAGFFVDEPLEHFILSQVGE